MSDKPKCARVIGGERCNLEETHGVHFGVYHNPHAYVAPRTEEPEPIIVVIERPEIDGPWIAGIPGMPGTFYSSESRLEAVSKALTLRDRAVLESLKPTTAQPSAGQGPAAPSPRSRET